MSVAGSGPLVVFLRGVNVGGHRRFRPSTLASELRRYDVVNIGAAGTFVVRRPGSPARFRAALLRRLPFDTPVAICDASALLRLERENPFGTRPMPPNVVRFVSILSEPGRPRVPMPIRLPPHGEWLVRVLAARNRFIFGIYRRHMRTISCLAQMDRLLAAPATTRNWNTILIILRILKAAPRSIRADSPGKTKLR